MVAGLARMVLLLALVAILGPFVVNALSKDDLYPYNGIGSSTLESNAEGQVASVEVRLKTPISFYENIYDTVYVSKLKRHIPPTTQRVKETLLG